MQHFAEPRNLVLVVCADAADREALVRALRDRDHEAEGVADEAAALAALAGPLPDVVVFGAAPDAAGALRCRRACLAAGADFGAVLCLDEPAPADLITAANEGFDQIVAAPGDAAALVGAVRRAATRVACRRRHRQRRLQSLGMVAQGFAEDVLDPVTLIRVNLEQLSEHLGSIGQAWENARQVFRARDAAELAAVERADRALRDSSEMVGECEAALNRVHRTLRGLPRMADTVEGAAPEPVALDEVVEAALRLTRAWLRPRCEIRADHAAACAVVARRAELQQMFVDLLLDVGGCLRSWAVLSVEMAAADRDATVTLRLEPEGEPDGLHADVGRLDLTEAIATCHRYGGALRVDCLDGGAAITVRLPDAG